MCVRKIAMFALFAIAATWIISDGVAGMRKAEEWGVSKPAAFIGGALGGVR